MTEWTVRLWVNAGGEIKQITPDQAKNLEIVRRMGQAMQDHYNAHPEDY